jgi:RNA polymerase sigma-70 factor, ECF subfamily
VATCGHDEERRQAPAAADLIGDELRGELAAFMPRLRRFALTLSRDEHEADDLVQTTLERALARWHLWEPGTRLGSWLCRILQNAWRDERRRLRVRGETETLADHTLIEDGEGRVVHRLFLAQVRRSMAFLPAEQRAVLDHVAFEGLSYRETAGAMGTSVGTVMSRLSRARRRLSSLASGETPA